MPPSPIPLVFGAGNIKTGGNFSEPGDVNAVFDTLEQHGIDTIDTAQLYDDSETVLGRANLAARSFAVDTKVPGGWIPGTLEPTKLRADAYDSLKKLGVKKLDIFYIHGPDENASIEDAVAVMNELHKEGLYSRFGLSNFYPADVRKIYNLCVQNGWVLPTVYQANYSAFARKIEEELIPTLRELGFAIYAYSPLAGGFLARSDDGHLRGAAGGRFSENGGLKLYKELYGEKATLRHALVELTAISKRAGCESPAELAYRWITSNSKLDAQKGDKVVFGASRTEQITKTVGWIKKGPLAPEITAAVDAIWPSIEQESPFDNWNR
ncbi:Aldo/keto reductase [Thozetella sp. PMI_491]|nr:Aldo/keto reductase [Thozetella sp. PMI_491]